MADTFTTVEQDFGKRLTQARLARGVTVEEAAHATRMRPGMIRALEDGNLSHFPNASYAKSFLVLYAKYLGTDVKDVARGIETETQMRVENFQYLTSRASEERRLQKEATDTRYDFVVPQKHGGSWLPLIIVAVLTAVGIVGFVLWNNFHRVTAAVPPPDGAITVQPTPLPLAKAEIAHPNPPGNPLAAGSPEAEPPKPDKPPEPVPGPGAPALAEAGPPPSIVPAVPAVPAIAPAPVTPPEPAGPEETTTVPLDPGTIVLEPHRKAWITIRNGPGGQMLYEDFLYPSAKPMHLPPGRYFIELQDAESVEISKDGKVIAYSLPGILLN